MRQTAENTERRRTVYGSYSRERVGTSAHPETLVGCSGQRIDGDDDPLALLCNRWPGSTARRCGAIHRRRRMTQAPCASTLQAEGRLCSASLGPSREQLWPHRGGHCSTRNVHTPQPPALPSRGQAAAARATEPGGAKRDTDALASLAAQPTLPPPLSRTSQPLSSSPSTPPLCCALRSHLTFSFHAVHDGSSPLPLPSAAPRLGRWELAGSFRDAGASFGPPPTFRAGPVHCGSRGRR